MQRHKKIGLIFSDNGVGKDHSTKAIKLSADNKVLYLLNATAEMGRALQSSNSLLITQCDQFGLPSRVYDFKYNKVDVCQI